MLIVANWKANKTIDEALEWVDYIDSNIKGFPHEIAIAPAFPQLYLLKEKIVGLKSDLKLCAQTVSNAEDGQFTGEVTAKMLAGLIEYCLIGHSERRKYFHETTEDVEKKFLLLEKNDIKPIISAGSKDEIPRSIQNYDPDSYLIMYEPPEAISVDGLYRPYAPEDIEREIKEWKKNLNISSKVLYGGSVNLKNVKTLTNLQVVNGFVVGHASLDVLEFKSLLDTLR
jgi:triosephosphate isomerase